MLDALRPFTAVCTRVNPATVVDEVDHALRTCMREKRPVHIQIPSDITHLEIEVPDEPFDVEPWTSDPGRLEQAIDAVAERLSEADSPVLLVDQNTEHYGYRNLFSQLVEKAQIPYAQLSSGKAVLNENSPLFLGTYPAQVRDKVEQSDLVITNNPVFVEANSASFSTRLPDPDTSVVNIGNRHVRVGNDYFIGVSGEEMLKGLLKTVAPAEPTTIASTAQPSFEVRPDSPLTQERLWPQLARFLRPGDVVHAEAGTSHIGMSGQRFPDDVTYVNSGIWGAIGYTLPATLGSQLAEPRRRHLLFIGDGSFQLTAQELSTILREKLNPIIVLVNNRGYTIERYILGMNDDYNDIANWRYVDLPKVFCPETDMASYSAATEGELAAALQHIENNPSGAFLEVHLDPEDAPTALKKFGPGTAEFDYGPVGPRNPQK